jgi:hypothetical protein
MRTIHTKVSLAADIVEILNEISAAYAADRFTPIREPSLSGALEKAARIYIAELKVTESAPPGLLDTITRLEQKYAEARATEAQESQRRNVVKFSPAARRGRPRRAESKV